MESQQIPPFVLLSIEEMRRAEAMAIEQGVAAAALMENAGSNAAGIIASKIQTRPAVVLCGPGANGGDGFVIARKLKEAGWAVTVALLGERQQLKGPAAMMADLFDGEIKPLSTAVLEGTELIIDALFGTGLSRALDGEVAAIVEAANRHPAPIVAIDIPSGVNADTGAADGIAIQAAITITFHLKKMGHVLFPGRALCGGVEIASIGIPSSVATAMTPRNFENHPGLWANVIRRPGFSNHKFSRGAVAVISGPRLRTGAARLGAQSALRIGAGIVTVLSPRDAADENAAHLTSIMIREVDTADEITQFLSDDRYKAVLVGPAMNSDANGGAITQAKVLAILQSNATAIIDADAITAFSNDPAQLFAALRPDDILTPHEGEFEKLFGASTEQEPRLERARIAAGKAGCVVVLKGPDTIIAAPDGRIVVNSNAPGDLATAGSGDALAGMIAGLKAGGAPSMEAAAAGVWFHGAAGQVAGPGLIAEDLPGAIPAVLKQLLSPPQQNQAPQAQNPAGR